jgi:hypothetical protein
MDFVYVALTVALLVLSIALIYGFDRLRGPK